MRLLRIAAIALVITFAGSPVLSVVCGFACQPDAMPMAAATPACHGEHHQQPDAERRLTARHGCDHEVSASLLMRAVTEKLATAVAATVNTTDPARPGIGVVAPAVEIQPGASPPAAVRPLVLRI